MDDAELINYLGRDPFKAEAMIADIQSLLSDQEDHNSGLVLMGGIGPNSDASASGLSAINYESLPDLPKPLVYAMGMNINGNIVICGGHSHPLALNFASETANNSNFWNRNIVGNFFLQYLKTKLFN